ncbi:FAD-binding domain-containing protein [Crassisporium funariophilum]|nr:FAD-binding domain-containing protein [Crassisporium funariophilum]
MNVGLSNLWNYFQAPNTSYAGLALTSSWDLLNTTVHGRLQAGVPWPEPCFSWYDGKPVQPDGKQCDFVQQNFFNNHLNRSQAFAAYSATQFETCMLTGDQCQLDWMNPENQKAFDAPTVCRQGSISDYFIDVKGKEDIIAAFKFTHETGVPLVIKNTGHDFKGRSSAPGSLALWMHNLKYITHDPNFVPEGCHSTEYQGTSAVTFGAGEQFEEIYTFADENGLEVVGGSDQSVGAAGGWGQGGGHSSLTPVLGMGADRTLQYKIVTPDGVYRIANSCQNKDLFFALRGGGGGTFGVVLEATMMASPAQSFRVANINWAPDDANVRQVMKVFLENATTFAEQGWGGYITPGIGNLILTNPKLNMKEAQESMKALIDLTQGLGGVSNVTEIATYFEWFSSYVQGTAGSIGLPNALASRLIPQKNHATEQKRAQLLDAIMSAIDASFFLQIHFTTPFGFKGSDGSDTSVNPIWRSSLYQIIFVNTWDFDSTLADRQMAYARSTKSANFLREITPDAGAYHNEADIHEPDWQWSFWNKNYERLVDIKKKYDPHHLLDCWQCIGWEGSYNPRYACYI